MNFNWLNLLGYGAVAGLVIYHLVKWRRADAAAAYWNQQATTAAAQARQAQVVADAYHQAANR
jgi:hypothetical protein